MYPESKSSDSSSEKYYKCQVRGSFCEISEERLYTIVAIARWQ